jgi:hypothetical protein
VTIVLGIGAAIDFLVIIFGVPGVLWTKKPDGALGLIWWLSVTLLVAIFSVASFVAALGLATSTSTAAHLVLVVGVLVILWMFFTRRAPSHP